MKNLLKVVIVVLIAFSLNSTYSIGGKIISINYNNNPPDPPHIEGPTNCKIWEEYYYNITITDPNGYRLVKLYVLFGDGTNVTLKYRGSSCCKGWRSGYTLAVEHKWKKPDDYSIRAKVKNYPGDWSDWGTFDVHVSKSKPKVRNPLIMDFNMLKIPNMLIKQLLVSFFK